MWSEVHHQSSSLPTLVGGRLEVKQKGSSALFPPCTLLANLLKHGSADTKQSRVVPVTGWVAPSDNRVSHNKKSKKPEAFPDSGFFFQDLARYAVRTLQSALAETCVANCNAAAMLRAALKRAKV